MLDEQRTTKSCGAETSVYKEYRKSKATSNSPCIIFLESDPCLRLAANSCNRSQASQTDGYMTAMLMGMQGAFTKFCCFFAFGIFALQQNFTLSFTENRGADERILFNTFPSDPLFRWLQRSLFQLDAGSSFPVGYTSHRD